MSTVQQEYEDRMAALTPRERMARSVAMLKWTRDVIGRQILEERVHDISAEELKWQVAARMYGSDPRAMVLVRRMLGRVSGRSV